MLKLWQFSPCYRLDFCPAFSLLRYQIEPVINTEGYSWYEKNNLFTAISSVFTKGLPLGLMFPRTEENGLHYSRSRLVFPPVHPFLSPSFPFKIVNRTDL